MMPSSVLLIVGLVLLGGAFIVIEIVLIPGIGVIGLVGFGAIIAASVLLGHLTHPLWGALLCIGTVVFSFVFIYLLPKTPFGKRLVLENRHESGGGYSAQKDEGYRDLLNKTGTTTSFLRPAGIAMIDDRQIDVVTQGEFIEAGSRIRVIAVEGSKITVEKTD